MAVMGVARTERIVMKPEPRTPFGSSMRPSLRQAMADRCDEVGLKMWAFLERAIEHELQRPYQEPLSEQESKHHG